MNFENHANYSPEFAKTLEMKLWTDIAEAGVYVQSVELTEGNMC